MTTFTRTWDAAYEALPADSNQASEGAQRIRNLRTDIRERLEVDHSYAGDTDDGMHKKVTFVDPLAAKPTQANDETYLYTKDVGGTSELFFEDEAGNEVQLTVGGKIEGGSLDAVAVAIIVGAISAAQHGTQTDSTLHADATASADGFATAAQITKLDGIETGATADQTGAEIKTAYQAQPNAFTDAQFTKLAGIETGATADQTAAEILTALKTVDGAGSGLDADLLDGNSSAAFALVANGVTNGNSHNHLGGDGGAIPEGGLAANAVDTTALKDASGVVTSLGTVWANFTLPGGAHGFYPRISMYAAVSANWQARLLDLNGASFTSWTSYVTNISLKSGVSSGALNAQQTYMTASPPYNLGNGDIPIFIFALINNTTKDIEGLYIALDPPWAYNGPTNILPDTIKNKKKYQLCIKLPDGTSMSRRSPSFMSKITSKLSSPVDREIWLDCLRDPTYDLLEVDQSIKQSDMHLIPHPFMYNNLDGKTVVLFDPIGSVINDLKLIHNQGDDISQIIIDNIKVDNTNNGAACPDCVLPVNIAWR